MLRGAGRGHAGGIAALAAFIDEHRGAVDYDWRARFHLSIRAIGYEMTWGEAGRLIRILSRDTSSQIGAELAEWQYPASRAALALADLYDATANAHYKRPKAYPRPWDAPPKRHGTAAMSVADLRSLLNEVRGTTSHTRDAAGRLRDTRGRFVTNS